MSSEGSDFISEKSKDYITKDFQENPTKYTGYKRDPLVHIDPKDKNRVGATPHTYHKSYTPYPTTVQNRLNSTYLEKESGLSNIQFQRAAKWSAAREKVKIPVENFPEYSAPIDPTSKRRINSTNAFLCNIDTEATLKNQISTWTGIDKTYEQLNINYLPFSSYTVDNDLMYYRVRAQGS